MKDFRVEAVPRASAQTAITLVNPQQMQTLAFRYVFEEETFPLVEQIVLIVVTSQSYTSEGFAPTTDTSKAVMLFLEASKAKADRKLRDLEGKYLRQDQSEEEYRVHHWRLKDLETAEKMEVLAHLHRKINEVVLAQLADPENPDAGKDLVPDEIYYNVVKNRIRYLKKKETK